MQPLILDFTTPEFLADPYPAYNRIRESAPLVPFDERIQYLIGGYDDCDAVLRDKRFGRPNRTDMTPEEIAAQPPFPEAIEPVIKLQRHMMLFRNPPSHTRLRGLVNKAFSPRMIENLRQRIRHITDTLLDDVRAQGHMDALADFALPLPVTVIAELLGVPDTDYRKFRQWSEYTLGLNDILPPSPQVMQLTVEANLALADFLRDLVAKKRETPGDDLLSALIAVEEQGERLTEDELISTALLILIAGFETTTNLIANGLLDLLRHPDQFESLKHDMSLVPNAIEEMLRYNAPVQMTGRAVMEDMDFHGTALKRFDSVMVLLVAGNRDPRRFSDPDTFAITRREAPPLTFGGGIHYCLGAPLARLEAVIAFEGLLQRMPDMHLAVDVDDLQWRRFLAIRGLEALPVRF